MRHKNITRPLSPRLIDDDRVRISCNIVAVRMLSPPESVCLSVNYTNKIKIIFVRSLTAAAKKFTEAQHRNAKERRKKFICIVSEKADGSRTLQPNLGSSQKCALNET